ncbi:STP1 protein, partial [Plasmodium ovale curtisi]
MADHSGYTILTKYIPVVFFIDLIKDDIKKLIHTYGHKNCGLRQEELCNKIKEIIPEKKKIIFKHMDTPSKKKWSIDWDSERSKHFDKLYKEEGFINMCFPKRYTNNPRLNQLLSKHIDFCKKKDERLSALRNKSEYNACKEHNMWIDSQRTSFTREYLKNAKVFRSQIVNKYFSTKEHPEGHDPLKTYLNSKLDCNLYNPPTRSHPKGPVEKAPKISLHSPAAPDLDQKSQGKGGRSIPGRDGGTEKEKSDVKISPQTEPPSSDSLTSSITNTKVDGTANDQHNNIKAKGTDLPSKDQGAKGKPNEATYTKAQSPEQLSEPKSSISSKDSPVAIVPDPLSSVIKDQGTSSDSTRITTSTTSGTTHSNQNLSSPSASDLSLVQIRPPAVAAVPSQHQIPATAQNSKETTPPDSAGKSTDQDVSLISSLDPGLAPPQAVNSNSSASETSSTTTSSTMTLTPGSSIAQHPHLPIPSTQPIVTTSIATTLTQTTTSVSDSTTITVPSMSTKPISSIVEITSTTGESEKVNTPLITITGSQDPNTASPKNQDDLLQPNKGNTSQTNTTHDQKQNSYTKISSSSGVSPAGPPPTLPASLNVVTKPDDNKIIMLPKETSEQTKNSTQDTSTSLPESTQPNGKPSIIPIKFPPLTSIIPTFVIILATITLLFLLYKYTPIGLFLGRKRRRKKRDLRKIFVAPEEPTYESPYKTMHKWDNNNVGKQIMENDIQMKLLEIKRYKQAIQKKKKQKKTTLIEMHMEVLEQNKNDQWKLHKGDFLEICLRGFINEENDNYSKLPNTELTVKSAKNGKTIEDIQKQEILWNNWIENHRNILEQWKEKE